MSKGKNQSQNTTIRYPTQWQREYLNVFFRQNRDPSSFGYHNIGQFLGMDVARVRRWFRNRRQTEKKVKEDKCTSSRDMFDGMGRFTVQIPIRPDVPNPTPQSQPNTKRPYHPNTQKQSQPSTQSYLSQGNNAVTASGRREGEKTTDVVLPSFNSAFDKAESGTMDSGDLICMAALRLEGNSGPRLVVKPAPFTLEPRPMWRPLYFNEIPQEWKFIDRSHRCTTKSTSNAGTCFG
ncbi:hypothetical protein BDP27DRAFT_508216 [Rhodocollybia butyracea]|uniref:Homeobox domain-containing protein n=1 Tax=Rhodocollybia butyracea TaxID=206335 RepID=A0A9P5P9J2_9AGAR|nr:hypothetical protein BDP27DRAFT_508216 [Rhodocollybia butyracea]